MNFSDLKPEDINRAATMIKAISHPMRLAIFGILSEEGGLTVSQIHQRLGMEQSTASHHLGRLKDRGILASERKGKNTLYFLRKPNLVKLVECISECACE